MNSTPGGATADPAALCEEARGCAVAGDLDRAGQLFGQVVHLGDTPWRAQAALGLAAIRSDQGDAEGAREADEIAIATEDDEYAPRAAYHLALLHERTGERDQARGAWTAVVEFGNPSYLPPAYLALAHFAEEDGDPAAAREWWERAIATRDEQYAPLAAHDLAVRMLEDGDAAGAQRALADAMTLTEPASAARAHLAVNLGIAHLEQAIGAFGTALDSDDPEIVPMSIELLARILPLRGRDDEAREVWRRGLDDERFAVETQARLDREPLTDPR